MQQRYKYRMMFTFFRWVRLIFAYLFSALVIICLINYKTSIYIVSQAKGQLAILSGTEPIFEFIQNNELTPQEKENILLIEKIKRYSIDSLDYLPTKNFTEIYDQKNKPILWVITASEPYAFSAFEWNFPVVGKVSYKGFFKKELAEKEYNHMVAAGYDVDIRSVSAWSTLGWFKDPLLSSMLRRQKGSLCNLLFHELFHATYYAPDAVNFNENIASFIAHKATLQFLKNDTLALKTYINGFLDNAIYNRYMIRKTEMLRAYYSTIKDNKNKHVLKLKAMYAIADSIQYLPLKDKDKFIAKKEEIFRYKNAYFIDFEQYDSMQDSLELIFNKIYKGDLKKLVQDLKRDKTIIKFGN